ncbi:hypothetical protein BDZ89DRAFT_1019649 [Hymenopellis radicata]|nr:hypothetical protein BDZ89DRAFT_1019649 [Hymenopellis radicata]
MVVADARRLPDRACHPPLSTFRRPSCSPSHQDENTVSNNIWSQSHRYAFASASMLLNLFVDLVKL